MYIDGAWIENVVRFPIERRIKPDYEMLCDLEPDQQMIPILVEHLNIEDYDPDLRHHSDVLMADYLSSLKMPSDPWKRKKFYDGLTEQALRPAIQASVQAKRAAEHAYEACRKAIAAHDVDKSSFADRAELMSRVSAHAAFEAHHLCEVAHGKYRAIRFAALGVPWVPFDAMEASEWLIDAQNGADPRNQAKR